MFSLLKAIVWLELALRIQSGKENDSHTKCIFNGLFYSWLMGRRPEFTDPKVVAQGEGREGRNFKHYLNLCWQS